MHSFSQHKDKVSQIDISEQWLYENYPKAFQELLKDRSSGENIYWATDSYAHKGEGFFFFDSISIEKIKDDTVIRPRVCKNLEEQNRRIKDKAEVFTPAWVCNAQNNLIDEAWFGRPNVFNEEVTLEDGSHSWIPHNGKIEFSEEKGKSWRNYVKDRRLEITCGEAPYLISRYDAVTGEAIPLERRIGMFDRKLQVITQEIKDADKWLDWAKEAVKSIYGFEWQGDSLLIAREGLLFTILEYFFAAFPDEPGNIISRSSFSVRVRNFAHFLSCNLWQMDGLNFVLPGTASKPFKPLSSRDSVFSQDIDEEIKESRKEASIILKALRNGQKPPSSIGIPAVVYDWWDESGRSKKEKQFFASIVKC